LPSIAVDLDSKVSVFQLSQIATYYGVQGTF